MKVAVVGCGNISKSHLNALSKLDDIEIVAAVDIKKDRAEQTVARWGGAAYTDFEEMLEKEHPDCVHICTPHYLHTQMAVKAMRSGAHVIVEKPCSVTMEEVDLLRSVQTETGKQVGICFQNRYNESAMRIKETIDSGSMGKVKGVRAFLTWYRNMDYYSDDWHGTLDKECGGVLINQAIHTIDLVQLFAGGCDRVTSHIFRNRLKDIEVEDTAEVFMELDSGVRCVVYATTTYIENCDIIIEVAMEKGTLRLEKENLYVLGPNGVLENLCTGTGAEYSGKSYWGHGHIALVNDFYDCVRTGRRFAIDSYEGGKAAKIVAACYESAKENKTIKPEG